MSGTTLAIVIIQACLIVLQVLLLTLALICRYKAHKYEEIQKQLNKIELELELGTPIEEILKMPMPKKIRKELMKIYETFDD